MVRVAAYLPCPPSVTSITSITSVTSAAAAPEQCAERDLPGETDCAETAYSSPLSHVTSACYLRMLPPHTALHLTSTEAAAEEEVEDPVESRTRTSLATTGWRTGGKHAHPPGHPPVASL